MSGALSVPNQFQNAVTATGLQLDNNFSSVTVYINDPTNRNNYIADSSGATNTVNLTFSPPVVGGYTTGLDLTWKWANPNSGATVVNANALGQSALVNPDGSALVAGQGVAGSIGHAAYDGTRFIYLNPPPPAAQAAMETATALATFVSPGSAKWHPGVSKAWVFFNGTTVGTQTVTTNGYNVSTVIRVGTGTWAVGLTSPMSSTNYAVSGCCGVGFYIIGKSTATVTVGGFAAATGAAADDSQVSVLVHGDFP